MGDTESLDQCQMKHQYIKKIIFYNFWWGFYPWVFPKYAMVPPAYPKGNPGVHQATTGEHSAIPGISLSPCASRTKHTVQQGKVCWHCVLDCVCGLFLRFWGQAQVLVYCITTTQSEQKTRSKRLCLRGTPETTNSNRKLFSRDFFLAEGKYGHT